MTKLLDKFVRNNNTNTVNDTVTINESEFANKAGVFTISISLEYEEKISPLKALVTLKDYIFNQNKKLYLYQYYDQDYLIEDYDLVVTYPIISHKQLKCNLYLTRDESHENVLRNMLVDKFTKLSYLIYAPTNENNPLVYKYKSYRGETCIRYEFEFSKLDNGFKGYQKATLTSYIDATRCENIGDDCPYIYKGSVLFRPEMNPIQVTQLSEVSNLIKECAIEELQYFQDK